MISHIQGIFTEITPAYVVVDCNGVGYGIHISLSTFEKIKNLKSGKLLTHLSIKEDSHTLFGFADETERSLFRHLISVNGVGAGTARMVLSSLPSKDLYNVIAHGNISLLKSIKGIGEKTAQRIVLELQGKLQKEGIPEPQIAGERLAYNINKEALDALATLGFNRLAAEKALVKISAGAGRDLSVEELIKLALKTL
jgi:Holliday junction DNA helicase RuvA